MPLASPTATQPVLSTQDQQAQHLNDLWAAHNWPEVIAVIKQIRAIDPNYDDMTQKLYAAHVNYGYRLVALGMIDEAKAE